METAHKIAKLLGLALSASALAIFIYVFADVLSASDFRAVAARHWSALVVATLIYCLAYVPMTFAWIKLVSVAGAQTRSLVLARVLLVSQIAKYLPGNIAQFLGRAYLARAHGVTLASSGLAIALELAGILAASGILAATAIALGMATPEPGMSRVAEWLLGIAGCATLVGSFWILSNRVAKQNVYVRPVLSAIGLYALVLVLLAGANVALISAIGGNPSLRLAGQIAGAFLVSWLIGFITPGSPAGLGLRELTFFSLLAKSVSPETVLLTAVAFRFATIIGDLIAWIVGLLLPRDSDASAAPEPIPL